MKKRLMVLVLVTTMLMAGVYLPVHRKNQTKTRKTHQKLHRKKQCKKSLIRKEKGRIK